jgi:NarL family two-component system response regulator LiaR
VEHQIKVFIVDDHDMVRLGLRTYLSMESGIEIMGEANNGKDAIAQFAQMGIERLPDVVLMDLIMPEMDGVETTKEVLKKYPHFKVIMLTSFLDDDKSAELHISIKTVKTHVSNLLMKCSLDDRTQLAIYAHRKGWVTNK